MDNLSNLTDYIKVVDLLSESECNYIMNCIQNQEYMSQFYSAKVLDPETAKSIDSPGRTNTQSYVDIGSPLDSFIYSKVSEGYKKWLTAIDNQMAGLWSLHYRDVNDSGYQINKYEETQFYDYHIDITRNIDVRRVLSMVIYINDDYEGGEIQFPYYSYKPVRGQAILFPSTWLYPHRSRPVNSGTKYSIVTWFLEKDLEDNEPYPVSE